MQPDIDWVKGDVLELLMGVLGLAERHAGGNDRDTAAYYSVAGPNQVRAPLDGLADEWILHRDVH